MANSDIRSTRSGWTYFTTVILLNVLFRSKNNNHTSRPSKVFTVWSACEARTLPIDLSGFLSGVSVLNLPQSTASIIMADDGPDDVNRFEKFAALLFILNACSL